MSYDNKLASKAVLVIPVYNEGAVIHDVVKNAKKHFKHIVCVNDGSKDNSRSEILRSGAYLVDHPINMGQGAALQTGIEFAQCLESVDYFVTFDADGQHRIEDVKNMLTRIAKGDVDIVLGSRFLGETIGMKRSKKVLLKVATRFSNVLSGVKLTDTHNGLRVFNRHVAETMQITMPDMAHASEILDIIARQKYRYVEVPVVIEYTEYSRSKGQAMINAVNIGFDAILRKISK